MVCKFISRSDFLCSFSKRVCSEKIRAAMDSITTLSLIHPGAMNTGSLVFFMTLPHDGLDLSFGSFSAVLRKCRVIDFTFCSRASLSPNRFCSILARASRTARCITILLKDKNRTVTEHENNSRPQLNDNNIILACSHSLPEP
mmetsp:Transcript_3654/g.13013  ORF Transcript_3654/g.13013 Transcript_3654/m.13013 type:complete len:143 (-) Transcript_3654:51-479(-)